MVLTPPLPGSDPVAQKQDFLERWATLVGESPERFLLVPDARDTRGEARRMREHVGSDGAYLVSTASHLPRAVMIFGKERMDVIPAPCNYWSSDNLITLWPPHYFYPVAGGLMQSERAVYEYLGLTWEAVR